MNAQDDCLITMFSTPLLAKLSIQEVPQSALLTLTASIERQYAAYSLRMISSSSAIFVISFLVLLCWRMYMEYLICSLWIASYIHEAFFFSHQVRKFTHLSCGSLLAWPHVEINLVAANDSSWSCDRRLGNMYGTHYKRREQFLGVGLYRGNC